MTIRTPDMKEEHQMIYSFLGFHYFLTGVIIRSQGMKGEVPVTLMSRDPMCIDSVNDLPVVDMSEIGTRYALYTDPETDVLRTLLVLTTLMQQRQFYFSISLNTVFIDTFDNSFSYSCSSHIDTAHAMYHACVVALNYLKKYTVHGNKLKRERPRSPLEFSDN